MTKKNYQTPALRAVELHTEGLIAASDRVPVNPTPGIPATNKHEGPWSCEQWNEEDQDMFSNAVCQFMTPAGKNKDIIREGGVTHSLSFNINAVYA